MVEMKLKLANRDPRELVNTIVTDPIWPRKSDHERKITSDKIHVIRFKGETLERYRSQNRLNRYITLEEYRDAKIKIELGPGQTTLLDKDFKECNRYHAKTLHHDLLLCHECKIVTCLVCGDLKGPLKNYLKHFQINVQQLHRYATTTYVYPDIPPDYYGNPTCQHNGGSHNGS
jgi:hypothetical protein